MSDPIRYEVKAKDLRVEEPFSSLLEIREENLQAITASMRENGFDPGEPIVVWHGVVVDGHTRLMAAKRAKIAEVPCIYRDFAEEDDAIAYAIHRQKDRRNLTAADLLRLVETLDKRKTREEAAAAATDARVNSAPMGALNNTPVPEPTRSSAKTAEMLGVSPRQVERIRTIQDKAAPDVKAAVMAGEKSIRAAYDETVQTAPKPKPEPKVKVSDDTEALKARIAELEAENTDLQERCNEAASLMQALQEENEAMQRTLDAEDLRGAFQKEVKRAHERARIAESRCTGLTVEVNELKGFCKMWKGKFERLEKANKKAEGAAA